jgi:hypothetical protein
VAVAITNPAGNIAGVAASSTVATYTTTDGSTLISIGAAAYDRVVVVAVGTELTSSEPTVCQIDFGGGYVNMVPGTTGTVGAMFARLFYLPVQTGTTANFKVTFSAVSPAETANHIAVFRVVGADLRPISQNGVGDTDADPITTGAVTVPTDGGKLVGYVAAVDTTARTWTGTTEDLDVDAGGFRFSTGFLNSGGSITTTVSGGNGEDGALSYLVFTPTPTVPPLNWRLDPPAINTRKILPAAVVAAGLFWSGFTPTAAPPSGDETVAHAAAQATVPYQRTILYQSLHEPVPLPLAAAQYAWRGPFSEPTRRKIDNRNFPTTFNDPFPRVSIAWFRQLDVPVRRKPTVYPQSAVTDPYPFTVAEYAWLRPLSEPTRRKPTVYPQSELPEPFPRTVAEYAWRQPLSQPVFVKPVQYPPQTTVYGDITVGEVNASSTPTIDAFTSAATIEVSGVVAPIIQAGGGGNDYRWLKKLRKEREEYEEECRLRKERAALKKQLAAKEREREELEAKIEDGASRQQTAHLRAITKSQMEFRLRIQAINAALAEIRARIAFEEDEEEVAMLLLHCNG